MTYRIAYMGTPDFSVAALAALIEAGHEVACVYSQPPRPAGRGKKDRPSPVHEFAAERGIEVRHPETLRDEAEQAAFAALDLDLAVVAAYGLILPKAILEAPRHGCLNIHASLLPRWRGAAPIQRAILAGDRISGVTVMRMDEGLDTGPMLLRESVTIGPKTNAGRLHDDLAAMGARMIVEALAKLEAGKIEETPQPDEGVTYAAKIDKAETRVDWSRPSEEVHNHIRGLSPFPGAWCEFPDDAGKPIRVKLLRTTCADGGGAPGTVLDDRLTIACGNGAIRILELQRAGRQPTQADAFLRGTPLAAGTRLL